nr:glycogen debranching protein [Rubrobacter sp.]
VYTIRGLYDLADMARSKGDKATANWAEDKARGMRNRFEAAWWFGRQGATQYADSLDDPGNKQVFQRHWIGVTPMDVDLIDGAGRTIPGLASHPHGKAAIAERELACYTDRFGMYHTGTGPTVEGVEVTRPFCDSHESEVPAERNIFTLNTAIMAVGEGNYGRLGGDQQRHYTDANADLQLIPDEQPGAMPEIAPSPDYGRSINKPFNERAMVLQAWGAYGTIWPVVHQQLGVRPDMGRDELTVVPQVPPGSPGLSGKNIRVGSGSVSVSADHDGSTYTTKVTTELEVGLTIGHTLPRRAKVGSVRLNGEITNYKVRTTHRGEEVLVAAPTTGGQTLVVRTR